jgi:hypothetical protein
MQTTDLENKKMGEIRSFKKPAPFTESSLLWPVKSYDEVCHTVRGSLIRYSEQRLEFVVKQDFLGFPVGISILPDGSLLTACADEKTRKLAKKWVETNRKAIDQLTKRDNPFTGVLVGKIPPIAKTANRPILVLSYIIGKGLTKDDTNTVCVDALSMQQTLILGANPITTNRPMTPQDHSFGKDLMYSEIAGFITVDIEKGNDKAYCPDLDTEGDGQIIALPVLESYNRKHPIDGYKMNPIIFSSVEHMKYMAFRKKSPKTSAKKTEQ